MAEDDEDIRVLIADPHRLFSEALGMALKQVAPEFSISEQRPELGLKTVNEILTTRPDLALVDYWMPEMEGPAIVERVLSRRPDQKIIMLSWLHGSAEIKRAIQAGVVAFLPKSSAVSEVAEAIRLAHRGKQLVFGRELMALSDTIDKRHSDNKEIGKQLATLTNRELEVLGALSSGAPIGEIAEQLFVTPRTIKAHITNILSKTHARSHQEAIAMARYAGLLR